MAKCTLLTSRCQLFRSPHVNVKGRSPGCGDFRHLRPSIGQDMMNGLALMHTHNGMQDNVGAVIFARKQPRGLQLADIVKLPILGTDL